MKKSRLRRVAVGLALSLGTLLAVLVVAEVVLRVCGYADNPAIYYDPEVGLRYYPNQKRRMLNEERVLGEFHTNEWGFRTPPFDIARKPGTTRVVCLGDSFTLGWGVDDKETWPHLLQQLCDRSEGPGRVEVLNLGQPDFNTVNEERLYRSFARRLDADAVILAYVLNDMAPETQSATDFTSKLDMVIGTTAIMRFLRVRFFRSWGIYQPANNPENRRRREELAAHIGEVLAQPDGPIGKSYWDVSMQALHELRQGTQAAGTPLLLVSFPDSGQVRSLHESIDASGALDAAAVKGSSQPQERLRRECAELGLPMLDLLEDFSRVGPALYGNLDGSHPAAKGHGVAALAVHAWLRQLDFIGPEATLRERKGQAIPDRGLDER